MATVTTSPRQRRHLRTHRKAARISLEEIVARARARERAALDARFRALQKRITAKMRGLPSSEQIIREMRDTV